MSTGPVIVAPALLIRDLARQYGALRAVHGLNLDVMPTDANHWPPR